MERAELRGQVAIVTGAHRGIGRAVADALRAAGALVARLDIESTTARDDGGLTLPCDVSDEAQVKRVVATVTAELGPVAILVNNAGIVVRAPIEETTTQVWQRTLSVNLTGSFFMTREVLPIMREAGYGRIIQVASPTAITGGSGGVAAYAASKAGLIALARAVAVEHGRHGITSNVVAPAWIDTGMFDPTLGGPDSVPVGRLGTPDDVADAILYLCRAHAGFVTGQVLHVNGGIHRG